MTFRTLSRAILAGAVAAAAAPAFAGPDFVSTERTQPLAASDARKAQQPLEDIVFPLDASSLGPAAQAQLAATATWLRTHPGYTLVLEGYTDSSGTEAYNEELATRRSEIVGNHLIASGVAPDRIVLAMFGERGARRRPDPLDRRVVMFASTEDAARLASAALDREAISTQWTRGGSKLRQTRGITPVAALEAPR